MSDDFIGPKEDPLCKYQREDQTGKSPPEPIPRHELVRELRRVAREPDIKTTAGAFIALANVLEKPHG